MTFENNLAEEPKDRTKSIWIGVVVAVALMVGLMAAFLRPESKFSVVRAKHILITCNVNDPVERANAYDTIEGLRERILKGERFEKLAKEYSGDPGSASRGGDLGWEKKGAFEGSVEAFVWSAPINTLSDVIQSKYGFHLVIVQERKLSEYDRHEMELRKRAIEQFGAKEE